MSLCAVALGLVACGEDEVRVTPEPGVDGQVATEPPRDSGVARSPGPRCAKVEAPPPKPDGGATPPEGRLDPGKTYEVVLRTSCGPIRIELGPGFAPKATASFAHLARTGFYDNTIFHRIVPGFVIQGGDPTGNGTGGPGYSTRDTVPSDLTYLAGAVAMAKTEAQRPGTAGSQFFIVIPTDSGLESDFAPVGRVVRGQDVVQAIEQLGNRASGEAGTPRRPVVLHSARLVVR